MTNTPFDRLPMNPAFWLRHAWMGLISAIGFFSLRWWYAPEHAGGPADVALTAPLFFESLCMLCLRIALFFDGVKNAVARNALFAVSFLPWVGFFWLMTGVPLVAALGFWQLASHLWPPRGMRAFVQPHRHWLFHGGFTWSVATWAVCFALLLPCLFFTVPAVDDLGVPLPPSSEGLTQTRPPYWYVTVLWALYFLVEGTLRAWRLALLASGAKDEGVA